MRRLVRTAVGPSLYTGIYKNLRKVAALTVRASLLLLFQLDAIVQVQNHVEIAVWVG